MTKITSREAQNRFGQLLDEAQKEPIVITRHERPVAVVISRERYEELEALEDAVWAARASRSAKGGFLGVKESAAFLEELLSAETKS